MVSRNTGAVPPADALLHRPARRRRLIFISPGAGCFSVDALQMCCFPTSGRPLGRCGTSSCRGDTISARQAVHPAPLTVTRYLSDDGVAAGGRINQGRNCVASQWRRHQPMAGVPLAAGGAATAPHRSSMMDGRVVRSLCAVDAALIY